MSTPILATKLYIPAPRPNLVPRPRLLARLNAGLQRKLTLISAPAGFGKTTLVSEWLGACAESVAWLSLDEGDNDPMRFLAYLVAALQTIKTGLGTEMLSLLQSPQILQEPTGRETVLAALLNDIATLPAHCLLVLDDYHLIDAGGGVRVQGTPTRWDGTSAIDQALTFLIDHLPPQLHLVITTREDPHLPLTRLRARSQLTELRAADLRFTPTEAADFLNQVMGLTLAAADIAVLEARTEGWIAGLQLAALSLEGHQDVSGFIQTFAGDNRYIVDYLVEEVLQRQPAAVRSFLLQTAILDHLNGPLCDAVTSQEGGKARLEALERGNFFMIPLDDKRHWYRYHHLFAEVLQAHLRAEQPALVPTLHQRASQWYEQHGSAAEAIRHALAAAEFERAANLVELEIPAMRQSRQESTVLGWLQSLPDKLVRARPVLSVSYAWVLLAHGELDSMEARLRDAEKQMHIGTSAVVVDEQEMRRLPGLIAIFRAGRSLRMGDFSGTVKYAEQALELAPEDDHLWQGAAAALLGIASWASGDLEGAHRRYTDGMASVQEAGNISDAISGAIAQADIRIAQGRLRDAMITYEQALQLATAHGETILRGTADLYVGMSELQREHNDLISATQHLLRSKELGEQSGLPQNRSRWSVAMASIKQAQGDLDGALDLLYEAERLYVSDFFPNVRPVAARKARLWLAQGRVDAALDWAREQGLSAQDELSYLREFEHITLARVLLARYRRGQAAHLLPEATQLLDRLLQAAEAGGRMGGVLEILVLQALAHQAQDDTAAALLPLERALTLAEPEGYVRLFIDEGEAIRLLILEFQEWHPAGIRRQPPTEQQRDLSVYADKLLAALGDEQASGDKLPTAAPSKIANHPSRITHLVEPLSERELDVLRLFTTELSGPEIAQHLTIGLSTVRTHTKSIYGKLNVNSRRAAVNRATELNLL